MSRNRTGIVRKPKIVTAAMIGLVAFTSLAGIATRADATNRSAHELVVLRSAPPAAPDHSSASDRARGLVFQGLTPGKASCAPGLAVNGNPGECTHGPDPAPASVDVTQPRTTEELVATTDEGAASSSSSTSSIPCYGDGTSGRRVQVVYAHAADVPDRFAELASSFVSWAAHIDKVFNDSAAQMGGIRHVRYVTDPGCNLVVQRVQLTTSGDDSFSNTMSELKSVGLSRSDRKYLVWTDATKYCGIATLYRDDSPGATNANNAKGGYARIDSGCWGLGRSVEAHELMHMLGGVQYTAPHTSGGGHCTDEYDRMCYTDSQSVTMTYPCSTSQDWLFDCNKDDYFSTSPAAGSYLATHWNTATSGFLEPDEPPAWSPSTTTTTTSSPSPSPSPSPSDPAPKSSTSTESFSGKLSRKTPSATYALALGTGTLDASLSLGKRVSSLTLTLVDPKGSTVASSSGPDPVTLTAAVSNGTYSLVVSGSNNASFTLTVTYPSP